MVEEERVEVLTALSFSKGKLDLLRFHKSLWMKREQKDNGGDKELEGQSGLEERKTKGTERCEKGSQQK